VVLLVLLLLQAGPASARTLTVCPSGCAYTQIAPALAAAHSGDTIAIGPGTYVGGFTIDISVKLVGAGAGASIIRGGGTVVTIGSFGATTEPTVSIDGVTITGGVARSSPESTALAGQEGIFALVGGIEIPPKADLAKGARVTIRNSVITGNRAAPSRADSSGFAFAAGGGVDNWGTLTLTNTSVTNNHVGGRLASNAVGGGIHNWQSGSLTLRHSIVNHNHAIASGPNACAAGGGGIASIGNLTVTGSAVSKNTVRLSIAANCGEAQGGGIFIVEGGSARISNTTIDQNQVSTTSVGGDATAFSGGIAEYGTLVLRNSTIRNNRVRATAGASGTANPTAGGIGVVFPGKATMLHTAITGNEVTATAAAGAAVAEGGGMQTTSTILSHSLVSGNRLIARSQTGSATVHGAGIQHGNDVLKVLDTKIRHNTAVATGTEGEALGGGIWNDAFFPPPPSPRLVLNKSTINDNRLIASPGITVHGGGLFTTV